MMRSLLGERNFELAPAEAASDDAPVTVALELKRNDRVAPLDYESASVLFTDGSFA